MTSLLIWMVAIWTQPVPSLQNPAPREEVYVSLPESERQQFKTALETLVALEKSGSWGEIYDKVYLNEPALAKNQFIEKRRRLRVIAFVPQKIYYVPPAQSWIVSGCAVFSPALSALRKKNGGIISDFAAKRTGTGWRFDAPPAITLYKDQPSGVRSCSVNE